MLNHDLSEKRRRLEAWGRILEAQIIAKELNQSEFANRCVVHVNDGVFGRDLVSNYIRGRHEPTPLKKIAMAKVLGITVEELMEPLYGKQEHIATDGEAPFEMRTVGDGSRARIKINRELPLELAVKIINLLIGAP